MPKFVVRNTVAVGGVLGSMFPLLHPVLVREAALRPRRTQMSRGLAAHWDKR